MFQFNKCGVSLYSVPGTVQWLILHHFSSVYFSIPTQNSKVEVSFHIVISLKLHPHPLYQFESYRLFKVQFIVASFMFVLLSHSNVTFLQISKAFIVDIFSA